MDAMAILPFTAILISGENQKMRIFRHFRH
jgi:hypothetical protein